jgi:hypothetical protein
MTEKKIADSGWLMREEDGCEGSQESVDLKI